MRITSAELRFYTRPDAPHDRTGQKRGKLTYVAASILYSGKRSVKWIARCDCGSLCIVDMRAQSCGCLRDGRALVDSAIRHRALSPEALADIRSSRERYKVLAYRWNVSISCIYQVKSGKRYKECV